ncbi:hypothetical protein DICVIV_04768 [Dictyocaulus viviparus]|uniref:Reverse transcriptase domain-containing protein n=1 Tax=Dictyocaulus viviparus TaxID=29172 RepID=A0A0D8XWU8_DICVI|nr:hypothetical protein DICVIV_04768 [Dictyocaulus viviparus]
MDSTELELIRHRGVAEAADNHQLSSELAKHCRKAIKKISREYKKPFCLTLISLKKAFDSFETEAVIKSLTNQALPTTHHHLFTATLENIIRKFEWDDMRVKIDTLQLHHFRFADDIVFIISNVEQATQILANFDI